MILAQRDPFGFEQVIYHPASGAFSSSIRALRHSRSVGAAAIDTAAIAGYRSGKRLADRTVLTQFHALPPGHVLTRAAGGLAPKAAPMTPIAGDLETLLVISLERIVRGDFGRAALALSGGLDSAVLLALLCAMGARKVPVYVLAADMPGYGERGPALRTARRAGAEVVVVEAGPQDFIEAVPTAMRHLEEPLYNLHPLAKLILARAMRRNGIDVAISGDGADQVLSRDVSADYLPLCRSLFEAECVRLVPPFLDAAVVAHLLSLPPDANKQCIRRLGRRLGVSGDLTEGAKQGRLAPPLSLDHLLPAGCIDALARRLGVDAPALTTDAERVHWATLRLLLADLGVNA